MAPIPLTQKFPMPKKENTNMSSIVICGLKLGTITATKESIKIVLSASKEDITAQGFDLGEIISVLTINQTAERPVEISALAGDE